MINCKIDDEYLQSAYKQQITDNENEHSWSKSNEFLIFYIAKMSRLKMKKHTELYHQLNSRHKYVMYPVIVFSTISGAINFNQDHIAIKYITSSISFVTAVLLSYVKFTNIGELAESHHKSYILYDLLYRRIMRELMRPKRERTHANDFINDMSIEYDDLIKISPPLYESTSRSTNKNLNTTSDHVTNKILLRKKLQNITDRWKYLSHKLCSQYPMSTIIDNDLYDSNSQDNVLRESSDIKIEIPKQLSS